MNLLGAPFMIHDVVVIMIAIRAHVVPWELYHDFVTFIEIMVLIQ